MQSPSQFHFLHMKQLKFVPATFLLLCFVILKESTCETGKIVFFISLRKLFSFLK